MAKKIHIIKKKIDFIKIHKYGKFSSSNNFSIKKLYDKNLNDNYKFGYKVTKKLGNAVKRNKAKRIMRELTKRNILKLKRKNFFYVFSAKKGLFNTPFKELEKEFRELVIKKWTIF